VVVSFRCRETEKLFRDEFSRRFQSIERTARRRLYQLDQARTLDDLSALKSNQFEALKGDRDGQYSIPVNDRYRICFRWQNGDAADVEIVDYH